MNTVVAVMAQSNASHHPNRVKTARAVVLQLGRVIPKYFRSLRRRELGKTREPQNAVDRLQRQSVSGICVL